MVTSVSSPLTETERESLYAEISALRKERDALRKERDTLKENANLKSPFSFHYISENDSKCQLLSGLSSPILKQVVIFLKENSKPDKGIVALCMDDQILLTFIKLRQNPTFEFLAHVAGVSKTTVNEYFWKWIDVMYCNLKFLIRMTDRDHVFDIIPPVFKEKFPRLTSIIDCFEIFIDYPRNLKARSQCYSQYKKHATVKVFISCTPLGSVNFLSKCWGGRASDIQIVRESGYTTTKYHMPGDQILADRGFTLEQDFALDSGSELIIPAFTRGKSQLPAKEIESTRKIASVRIHIERVIGLIKNRYTILKGVLPIKTVKTIKNEKFHTIPSFDKIITVCGALVNLGESIVYKE